MAYRTYIDGVQLFGNNESYAEWYNFLRSEGVGIDDCGCYDGTITDVDRAVSVLESIVAKEMANNINICNFKELVSFWSDPHGDGIYDACNIITTQSVLFLPYTFIKILSDSGKIEPIKGDEYSRRFCHFQLKDGETVSVTAR